MYIQGVGHEEYLLYSNIYTLTLWKCIILGIILQIIESKNIYHNYRHNNNYNYNIYIHPRGRARRVSIIFKLLYPHPVNYNIWDQKDRRSCPWPLMREKVPDRGSFYSHCVCVNEENFFVSIHGNITQSIPLLCMGIQ